jgi:hypothetical protein
MPDGTLGEEYEPGKFRNNNIPGAEDADEAFDLRRWKVECFAATSKRRGPRGIVTHFKPDPASAKSETVRGDPVVRAEGATVCIIVPQTQVTTVSGTKTYFQWYDHCCKVAIVETDCTVVLEFVKSEQETARQETTLDPEIRCVTDWPRWVLEKITDLIKQGVSLDSALTLVKPLLLASHNSPDEAEMAKVDGLLASMGPALASTRAAIRAVPRESGEASAFLATDEERVAQGQLRVTSRREEGSVDEA